MGGWCSVQGSGVVGGRHVLSIDHTWQFDPHVSCCHAMSFVAFPTIVEQGFERWLCLQSQGHLCVSLCLCWECQAKEGTYQGKGCADHHVRVFFWVLPLNLCQFIVGESLDPCLPCRYHQLFPLWGVLSLQHQCKVTICGGIQCKVSWCEGYPRFPL